VNNNASGSGSSYDSTAGEFEGLVGDAISARYKITAIAGRGTFGRVLECRDADRRDQLVAIKVIRRVKSYCAEARIEADIVKAMNALDTKAQWHCVTLLDTFEFDGHYCLVFERLGPSLYEFIQANDHQPLEPHHVQQVAKQLLEAVCFLHHSSLIHTDLKPECAC